ncbi:F-box protein At5g07610-like [Camellia sinensis]|uniref:F-box protein At5g07610-like n=1 Tax=Camellia sinensis TaxID=4442 RepID=UPI0010369BD3|nr:F-box protein At5g07610-like [Camellia sinensis]
MTKKAYSKRRRKAIIDSTSSERSPASEEVIASNEDLLTEILLRLPAKSLIRFKSVSKNWLHLISDSHFAVNHSRRIRNSSMISGLFFYYDYSHTEPHCVSLHAHPNCNLPTLSFLNKFTLLPQLDFPCLSHESLGVYLAFDPSKSPHYKVVFFRPCYQFDIYSSETASWKQITVSECEPLRDCLEGVFWNGAIHWLSHEDVHFRFDVDEEKLIKTHNPPSPKILSVDKTRYFGECGGHLLLIQMRLRNAMGFKILEMDRVSFHWIVKCGVNLRPLISVFPEIDIDARSRRYKFRVLCVVTGVSENDFALVLATAGKVVYYDLKCKTSRVLLDHIPLLNFHASIFQRFLCSHTYKFVESLSPI